MDERAVICVKCGVAVPGRYIQQMPVSYFPKYYKSCFVIGIIAVSVPFYGFIMGIIGLPLSIIAKRRSAIVMNSIGITVWLIFFIILIIVVADYNSTYVPYYRW